MKYYVKMEIPKIDTIMLELTDSFSAKTTKMIVKNLPFSVGIHLWGDEIYTDPTPVSVKEENSQSLVNLNDVAYWPEGNALCLFYGPTPIGKKGEIKPYSPVNIIGKILNPDKSIFKKIHDGNTAIFQLVSQ